MATDRFRVGLAPRSDLQTEVLQLWAQLEGRALADLCLTLIEQQLREAARNGDMPQPCVDLLRCSKGAR